MCSEITKNTQMTQIKLSNELFSSHRTQTDGEYAYIIPHTHQPRITLLLARKPLVVRGRSISKLMSRLPPVLLFDDGPAVPGALFQLAGLLLPPIVAVRALASGDGGKRTTSRLKAPLKSNSKRRLFIRLPL